MLLARERLDRLIKWVTATWTIRIGLLVEAGLHLTLATARSVYPVGAALVLFGIHAALWTIASSSLRQPLGGRRGVRHSRARARPSARCRARLVRHERQRGRCRNPTARK